MIRLLFFFSLFQTGDKCMVLPSVPEEEAKTLFPAFEQKSVPSGKGYLRFTPQPK